MPRIQPFSSFVQFGNRVFSDFTITITYGSRVCPSLHAAAHGPVLPLAPSPCPDKPQQPDEGRPQSPSAAEPQPEVVVRVFKEKLPVHKLLLICHSGFFKTKFESWTRQASPPGQTNLRLQHPRSSKESPYHASSCVACLQQIDLDMLSVEQTALPGPLAAFQLAADRASYHSPHLSLISLPWHRINTISASTLTTAKKPSPSMAFSSSCMKNSSPPPSWS